MARRRGSDLVQRSQNRPRPVVVRIDELADAVPAPSGADNSGKAELLEQVRRTPAGTVADRESAAALGLLGARAKIARDNGLRVLVGLGLRGVPNTVLAPYLDDAEALFQHEVRRIAAEAGGGICGVGPSSIVQSAALQLAGSRAAFAAGELITGSRLADASRANLLSARHLAAQEAQDRTAQAEGTNPTVSLKPAPYAFELPKSAADASDSTDTSQANVAQAEGVFK